MKDKILIKGCYSKDYFPIYHSLKKPSGKKKKKTKRFEQLILEDLLGKEFSPTGLKRILQITKG